MTYLTVSIIVLVLAGAMYTSHWFTKKCRWEAILAEEANNNNNEGAL
jgi:hypothetical protein